MGSSLGGGFASRAGFKMLRAGGGAGAVWGAIGDIVSLPAVGVTTYKAAGDAVEVVQNLLPEPPPIPQRTNVGGGFIAPLIQPTND